MRVDWGPARARRTIEPCTRLLRREPTAPSDLADRHLTPLIASLRRAFPRRHFPDVDDALIETVAIDPILDLAERPERYDPNRGALPAYLRMAAKRDVQNARERERRRARRSAPLEAVELRPAARNIPWAGASDPADAIAEALALLLPAPPGRPHPFDPS